MKYLLLLDVVFIKLAMVGEQTTLGLHKAYHIVGPTLLMLLIVLTSK